MAWYNLRKPSARTTKTHKPESGPKKERSVPLEVGEMQSMDAPSTLPRSSDDRRYVSTSRRVQSSTAESM